ncbi:lipopolysaccharide core biosynthesis protein [Citrobacter braakii]|uniref:3-deoxy-D-manno-oct-2-ulosonate III transferase WaaZ n=1 Tax=Citrobacter braakii TaxID=57706 RepID=UPI000DFE2194|nr:3-deoxy-D-manno-oct-2-ulosonate III transferase WaaZ [Citrobacter braakii]STJ26729.1 lipopolysaccharide core biosynthesis protein [Citrobacter braakii]
MMNITKDKLKAMKKTSSDDCIIYLSGPSSLDTPIELLRSKNIISVNGSTGYLQDNKIPVLAYIVCDGSFYEKNKSLFLKYSAYAEYTFISTDVLKRASEEEKKKLLETCFVLNELCQSRGGPGRKIRYALKSIINKEIFIQCSVSKKEKTIAFSTDICKGHFGSATVAFSALQLAISLNFMNIYFSGLDLNGKCERFYKENKPQPTNLPSDLDFILKSFSFFRKNNCSNIFNLSKKTSIPYEIIPFKNINEI